MLRIFLIIFLCLGSVYSEAQVLSTSGTITDADGQTWNGGSYKVQLYSPNGTAYYNGTLVPTAVQSGALSASGAFSGLSLYNTNTITPNGAQYSWTICSNTSALCSTFNTPVTSTDLSSALSALVSAPRFEASSKAYGYLDVEVTPTPSPGQGYFNVINQTARIWNGFAWVSGGEGVSFPSDLSLVAHWDMHDGTGTTVTDISGANACAGGPCNITLTSGNPAGTVTPTWIPAPNGVGAGLAMGASPNGNYGLPNNMIGTSCAVTPVLQNQVRTIAFQYEIPPAIEVYPNGFIYPILFGSTLSTGQQFNIYNSAHPRFSDTTGNLAYSNDDGVGLHDIVISIPVTGNAQLYFDGKLSTNLAASGPVTRSIGNFVLGCQNGVNGGPSTELYLFDMLLGSSPATAIDAAQYHTAVQAQIKQKAFIDTVSPHDLQQGYNQFLAVGDSTTRGTTYPDTGASPWAFCLQPGTSNCYGGGYSTALAPENGKNWDVSWYGMPGAGSDFIPWQVPYRENKVFGISSGLHVAVNWSGINGLQASLPASCAWAYGVTKGGWQPWLMTLYSQGIASVDQANRDPYNNTILANTTSCGYHVINIAEDAFIGKDGQNATTPYWGGTNVHMAPNGYAYVASIVSRCLAIITPRIWLFLPCTARAR